MNFFLGRVQHDHLLVRLDGRCLVVAHLLDAAVKDEPLDVVGVLGEQLLDDPQRVFILLVLEVYGGQFPLKVGGIRVERNRLAQEQNRLVGLPVHALLLRGHEVEVGVLRRVHHGARRARRGGGGGRVGTAGHDA